MSHNETNTKSTLSTSFPRHNSGQPAARKSAFELRAGLLIQAQSILNAQRTNSTGVLENAPTTEEIIAEATKLNEFVSSRSND